MTTNELLEREEMMKQQHQSAAHQAGEERQIQLFPTDETETLRDRWHSVQADFVDNPRQAVQHADELVAHTITRLTEMFANERNQLEGSWSRGNDVSTEDLRQALRRYRSFFDRLLSM